MSEPDYEIYCQFCHYKKTFSKMDVDGMSISRSCDVQAGIPKFNAATRKIDSQNNKKGKPKVKCPNCGRVIFIGRYYGAIKEDNPS